MLRYETTPPWLKPSDDWAEAVARYKAAAPRSPEEEAAWWDMFAIKMREMKDDIRRDAA